MKAIPSLTASAVAALSPVIFAADEPAKGCAMMKPQAEPGCSCCCKMKSEAAANQPTLDELLAKAKDARGDQLLDTLAAIIDKLVKERNAAQSNPAPIESPKGHQH